MYFLIWLAFSSIVHGVLSHHVQCGVSINSNSPLTGQHYIVGGEEANKDSWRWMASIGGVRDDTWRHMCGASIISKRWILTAAHCILGDQDLMISQYEILVGAWNLQFFNESNRSVRFDRIIVHEKYLPPPILDYDMALIHLSEDLKFSQFITPVCLADSVPSDNTVCIATGWGNTYTDVDPNVLRDVRLPLVNHEECHSLEANDVTVNMICAGEMEGGKDTCQGDSGGPLFCEMTDGRWAQVGITSWGVGCGEVRSPGIYTNVPQLLRWIRRKTKLSL